MPLFLPDPEINLTNRDHYKKFEDVFGTPTTERDMPSAQAVSLGKVAEDQQVRLCKV
mgnify:FL=1